MKFLVIYFVLCVLAHCSHSSRERETSTAAPERDASTYLPRRCVNVDRGDVTLSIDFISYYNPSDNRATGQPCDTDSPCDIFFEICISRLNKTDCELYSSLTEVVTSNTIVSFSPDIGGQTNPIRITTSAQSWKGVKISISVWDQDPRRLLHDQIDEFRLQFTEDPGSYPRVILAEGLRPAPKSSLYTIIRLFCPTAATTTPTTITTTVPTTTTPSTTTLSELQQVCNSAIVFNETERLSRTTVSRNTYINDLYTLRALYQPWFRFDGPAGKRLYQTSCASYQSCGAAVPIYTTSHPSVTEVGTICEFTAYGRSSSRCGAYALAMHVMLCPNNDYVYRYTKTWTSGSFGFCGSP